MFDKIGYMFSNIGSGASSLLKKSGLSLDLEGKDRTQILWLTVTFFFVIGSYTVLKEMKDILFSLIVGSDYMSKVKIISMFTLIPAVLLYAKLVDFMSRLKLLTLYSLIYSVAGFIIAYLLADPVMGLNNTIHSPDRYFGWVIYLFYEGLTPFVISVFWAFANSITTPAAAKKGYALLIAGSKFGGMFAAGFSFLMLSPMTFIGRLGFSTLALNQIILTASSVMLAIAPLMVYLLTKNSSKKDLDGYAAAHKFEEKQKSKGKNDNAGMLSGLFLLIKHPYVLGIFGMFFFYELVNVVLGIQRTIILQHSAKDSIEFGASMFGQRFIMHSFGFLISFFGTRSLVKKFGERICLLLIPLITGVVLTYFMLTYSKESVLVVFMILGTLNYSFASPLREALYIPTVKDVRFKSKSWIESFGQRFSKTCGSVVSGVVNKIAVAGSPAFLGLFAAFFAIVVTLWTVVAWFLGKKYESLIKNNEAVGAE